MKQFLDNLFKCIEQNRKTFWLLLVLPLFSLFHRPLEVAIDKVFVESLFSKVNSSYLNDFFFLIIALITVLYALWKFLNKKIFKLNSIIIYTSIALIYSYYRFFSDYWDLISFKGIPFLSYTDIWLFLPLLFLKYHYKAQINNEESNKAFVTDEFGRFKSKDGLHREHLGKEIAERINSSTVNKSFAIGIVGVWGSGKTVFLTFIEKHLDTSISTVKFNPWLSQNPNQIINDFFSLLKKEIGKYTDSLDKEFIHYIDQLITINKNTVSQLLSSSKSLLFRNKSTEEIYETIDQTLRKLNKKIVVFIDDLDRLDQEEIFEVLRLIRNTANFYNIFYVVAYDRAYVINSLKKVSEHNVEYYLEKIFQYEFKLPNFDYNLIKLPFYETLKQVTDQKYHEDLKAIIFGDGISRGAEYLPGFIENMRDVARFPNSFGISLSLIGEEILLSEFFYFELLKFKYPSLYNLLYNHREDFFIQSFENGLNENLFALKKDKQNDESLLELYIRENYKILLIPANKLDLIVEHTIKFFEGRLINSEISILSIRRYDRFHIYFTNSLFVEDLSEGEFEEYRRKGYKVFEAKVKEWIDEGKLYKLKKKLEEINGYNDVQDFKKIIKIIFFILRLQDNEKGYYMNYNHQDLINKLSDWDDHISKKYFAGDKGEYKNFIKELILEAKYPYWVETAFIAYLFETKQHENFILNPEELKEIQLRFFSKFIEEHAPSYSDSYSIYFLYWRNIKTGN